MCKSGKFSTFLSARCVSYSQRQNRPYRYDTAYHNHNNQYTIFISGTDRNSKLSDNATLQVIKPFNLLCTTFCLQVLIGKVEGIQFSADDSRVTGVKVDGKVIPADIVVIAMGPWSRQAVSWFNIPEVMAQRAHSILLRTDRQVTAEAVFAEHQVRHGKRENHEVYPRPDGDVYTCGESDDHPLPDDPNDIQPNPAAAKKLKEYSAMLSSELGSADMYLAQACYLPLSPDNLPLIGKIPSVEGAYIATGHACWGILNSPATGEVIAELIATGKCTVIDPKAFDPSRFTG